jgi:hypoxanthine-DNA glycosylase
MINRHPFEPFIPKNATKLIIGTIPPPRFCLPNQNLSENDVNFYYGSADNHFWCLIGKIFKIDFVKENTSEAVKQRKSFLKKHDMGITDIIDSCKRKNNSASDNKLKDIEYKNIKSLLSKNKNIKTLIYTSERVKRCMNDIYESRHSIYKKDRKSQTLNINGKNYKVHILYSPSRQALKNMGKNGQKRRRDQYKKVFIKFNTTNTM